MTEPTKGILKDGSDLYSVSRLWQQMFDASLTCAETTGLTFTCNLTSPHSACHAALLVIGEMKVFIVLLLASSLERRHFLHHDSLLALTD